MEIFDQVVHMGLVGAITYLCVHICDPIEMPDVAQIVNLLKKDIW